MRTIQKLKRHRANTEPNRTELNWIEHYPCTAHTTNVTSATLHTSSTFGTLGETVSRLCCSEFTIYVRRRYRALANPDPVKRHRLSENFTHRIHSLSLFSHWFRNESTGTRSTTYSHIKTQSVAIHFDVRVDWMS